MNEIRRNKMNMMIMLIGLGMIAIPTAMVSAVAVVAVFKLTLESMIEAYTDKDISKMMVVILFWSFIIGTILVVIGSV